MINITKYKNKEKSTVEYELEVTNENKIIFSAKIEINKNENTDKMCDRLAKIKLLNILMEDGCIEILEELSNLIPVYLPKEEYLQTQKDNFLY